MEIVIRWDAHRLHAAVESKSNQLIEIRMLTVDVDADAGLLARSQRFAGISTSIGQADFRFLPSALSYDT